MISVRRRPGDSRRPPGFTLVELLVVIAIIILVSAVALPTILPALAGRQVSEATRILQAALAGARDAAIRANAPRGIRLLPDLTLSPTANPLPGQILTSNRIIPIEPAPDLTDASIHGSATFVDRFHSFWTGSTPTTTGNPPAYPYVAPPPYVQNPTYLAGLPVGTSTIPFQVLIVAQSIFQDNAVNPSNSPVGIFNPPTNWFWNVRIGDRFRFNDSGRYYTVVGPMTTINPEGFVNDGLSNATSTLNVTYGTPGNTKTFNPEYLFLVNGYDDFTIGTALGDGYPDNGFDGVDQNTNGIPDDIEEWAEAETWIGSQILADFASQNNLQPIPFAWTIARRPVPSPGGREVTLPGGAVIDLTTWDFPINERSRLPVDRNSHSADILVNQAGQVIPTTLYSTPSSNTMAQSFYQFWITERGDVTDASGKFGNPYPNLPVGSDVVGTRPSTSPTTYLTRERMLLTLFTKTGQVVTNSIEGVFDYGSPNAPYYNGQLGTREAR